MQCELLTERVVGTESPKRSRNSSVDNADFSELVRLHHKQVFRVCLNITRNHHDAEDATQDCFLRAFSHLHQFQGKAQFSTWLNSIARNCSLMHLRKRRNRTVGQIENAPEPNSNQGLFDPPDSRPNQLSCCLYAESSEMLLKSIAALPTNLRTTADLIILDERTLQEASSILDISSASVKSRLFRARNRLKRAFKTRTAIKCELR